MNLWFRLIRILLSGIFAPHVAWDKPTQVHFRVWPSDLDINLHMTNSRYLALMDLGRTNLLLQSGLWKFIRREKLAPVIAGSLVRFRRPIKLFDRITLTTQVIGWDSKWMFIEHRLERRGELACQAIVKGVFVGNAGSVSPSVIAKRLGQDAASPPLPAWIAGWLAAEYTASRERKEI
ncbi:MAG TPA: thioesterase family protein [Aestuariivirga sp.]